MSRSRNALQTQDPSYHKDRPLERRIYDVVLLLCVVHDRVKVLTMTKLPEMEIEAYHRPSRKAKGVC